MALEGEHHVIRREASDPETADVLAWAFDASPESVVTVLGAGEGQEEGRSRWTWIRFENGDLALAVFPRGETYFEVEVDAALPYKNKQA